MVILYNGANPHALGPNPGFHSGFRRLFMGFTWVGRKEWSSMVKTEIDQPAELPFDSKIIEFFSFRWSACKLGRPTWRKKSKPRI